MRIYQIKAFFLFVYIFKHLFLLKNPDLTLRMFFKVSDVYPIRSASSTYPLCYTFNSNIV